MFSVTLALLLGAANASLQLAPSKGLYKMVTVPSGTAGNLIKPHALL